MKVVGSIESVPATVLLDSGSSHNFLSESLAQKIQLQPVKGPTIRVMVASGEKLTSKGKCVSVMVKLWKFFTKADFYILSLEGYDVVMGTQWLRTLGEIMWDFSKMIMRFQSASKMITLKGLTNQVVDSHEINHLSSKQPVGALVQIMAIEDHDQLEQRSDAPELQELLGSFSEFSKSLLVYLPIESMIIKFHYNLATRLCVLTRISILIIRRWRLRDW